ncbi:hypothetical protein JTB14_031121 [Gonioctena quinquepunctata]|nr:hypothetical protein JTB14_031121 [Gonioctena quinquepunctata]
MISAGVEGRLPYMTYPEPWRGPPKQPPELFLRPAPKPLPPSTSIRYNGVNTTTYPNGTRLAPAPSPISKYPSPPSTITKYPSPPSTLSKYPSPPNSLSKYPSPPSLPNPVNLAQPKGEVAEDMSSYSPYRLFTHPQFSHFAYPVCQPHYMGEENTSSAHIIPAVLPVPSSTPMVAFKIPSGKEGSLKHRILTRPDDTRSGPLDLQKPQEGRKRLQATMSPPRSPKKSLNNNTLPSNFAKGSLIQLHNGELRRIEDMRTEDFILSAARSAELRLAESTVLKIEESPQMENATITLTYNNRCAQVDMESRSDHPYFVMGSGWASCNPDRTLHCYGLKVQRLRVGDVLISLTPRETATSGTASRAGTTIITTATTTSMTARQQPVNSVVVKSQLVPIACNQTQPMNLHRPPQSMSPESMAARKRRWSAPDQICEEEQMNRRRHRVE